MNDPDRPLAKSPQHLRREKRLAEALRANLKRRKAAARPVSGEETEASPDDEAAGPETGDKAKG